MPKITEIWLMAVLVIWANISHQVETSKYTAQANQNVNSAMLTKLP
jgi:hypothetical protein